MPTKLSMKKDDSHRFCGDYQLLNLQTQWDYFSMPLVENVLT
jgi:hypothetical protein